MHCTAPKYIILRIDRDNAAKVARMGPTQDGVSNACDPIGFSWCFPSCSESPTALVSERLSQGMAAIGLARMTRFFITHH